MLSQFLSPTVLWFVTAFAILGLEMLLGTYYLLALAFGAFLGAFTSFVSYDLSAQFTIFGLGTCIGAIAAIFIKKKSKNKDKDHLNNLLDVGQIVTVTALNADKSGTAFYRGANWSVRGENFDINLGQFKIVNIVGNTLIVTHI